MARLNPKTAILLPSLNRPERLARCLNSLRGTSDWRLVDTIVMLDLDDHDSDDIASRFDLRDIVYTQERRGSVYAWNSLLKLFDHYAAYVAAADDLIFHQGWYRAALDGLASLGGSGLVGFNDLNRDGNELATHWLATREFLIKYNGGVLYPPGYTAWYCDPETNARAKRAGQFIWAKDAIVEHRHPDYGKALVDQTYAVGLKSHEADRQLYLKRQAAGWPDDFEPILKADTWQTNVSP